MHAVDVTLLGPQRRVTAARAAVGELMPEGRIATVNAGWQERETDSSELGDVLGGRMVNLELYRRWQEIVAADDHYARAERRLTALLAEIQAVYAIRLNHAMASLEAVSRRKEIPGVQTAAMFDSIRALQELDRWHLEAVAETRHEFFSGVRLGERASVLKHRAQIAELVSGCSGMVFAGGHVGVLLHVLQLFAVTRPPVVIAWSAGAMALTERVLLFHDRAPHGPAHAEFAGRGLGWLTGCVLLPHARRRLHTEDPARMAELAVRAAPARCVVLDDGTRLDLDGASLPNSARVVAADGRIGEGVAG